MSDSWEQLTGIQSPGGDSDGDGYLNLAEHNSGSDPLSSASVPPPAALPLALDLVQTETPSGNSALRWSASDPAVLLMESTDLAGWNPVVQGIRTEGNMKVFDLPMSTVRRSFYHLRRRTTESTIQKVHSSGRAPVRRLSFNQCADQYFPHWPHGKKIDIFCHTVARMPRNRV